MKLGEALTQRSQLQKRFGELSQRIAGSVFAQEGESPPEDAKALLAELEAVGAELERLIAGINKANLTTTLADGRTVTDALARRDHLTILQSAFQKIANTASESQVRYGKAEIKMVRLVDVAELRRRADELAKERRELDAQLQETNWLTDLPRSHPGPCSPARRTARRFDPSDCTAQGPARGTSHRAPRTEHNHAQSLELFLR